MKNLLLITLLFTFLMSCSQHRSGECLAPAEMANRLYQADSLNDSKDKQIKSLCDSIAYITTHNIYKAKFDSLQTEAFMVQDELFLANLRIEKVKKYLKIVNKDASQREFFKYYLITCTQKSDKQIASDWLRDHPEPSSQEKFLRGWIGRAVE